MDKVSDLHRPQAYPGSGGGDDSRAGRDDHPKGNDGNVAASRASREAHWKGDAHRNHLFRVRVPFQRLVISTWHVLAPSFPRSLREGVEFQELNANC